MMIVQIGKMSSPSSWECAQRLYEKNIELEKKRRRSAQARIPSDPNAWQQIRENYEAIILEDHAFSEQHNVEFALWQLHYKRIEELRAHYNAAQASAGSNSSQGVKGPTRPDRLTKIRLQFKTFLSEASGFYHDLNMKIRAKYGLPLGHFAEDPENQIDSRKDGKKSSEMMKGLISCHRCLIYLGDLARYKGSYGEGDSKNREYAAASSYYLQAASLCPSSGNPHHQLAILASYSGDELVAIYRYFRSLAVDAPFTTARDNLIVAFEKNRQSYAQLPGDVKAVSAKESSGRLAGKERGRMEVKADISVEASHTKEKTPSIPDTFKSFCIRFVRLHGILFTRTSLETFPEILSMVSRGLCELLSSGPEELLNLGTTAIENGLVVVRIVAILINTVHNVSKETDNQTYAEIVQRAVLLQSAFSAAFGLMGQIVERCAQLRDSSNSYLLPGILIFLEWLAFNQHFAVGNDVDDNQTVVRTRFWNGCISFLNKVLSLGPISVDDEDDSCFNYMSKYEEGETENRLALWEDFELRGFVPLVPAQSILDFSRKHSLRGDKERKARVRRILTAGKALANIVRVDQKYIYYDAKAKKFVIDAEPQMENDLIPSAYLNMPFADIVHDDLSEKTKLGAMQLNLQQFQEGEEEDEVIVFKPVVTGKQVDGFASTRAPCSLHPGQVDSEVDLKLQSNSTSRPLDNLPQQSPFEIGFHMPVANIPVVSHHQLPIQTSTSQWLDNGASLATSLQGLGLVENGHLSNSKISEAFASSSSASTAVSLQHVVSANNNNTLFGRLSKVSEAMVPSKGDILASSGGANNSAAKTLSGFQGGLRKSPVSRPSRHLGPPPGFSSAPAKQVAEPSGVNLMSGNPILDDYSWLDGYQLPLTKGLGHIGGVTYVNTNPQQVSNSNGFGGSVSFPFPGKQVPSTPHHKGDKQNGWQDYQMYEYLKAYNEQQLLQQQPQTTENQHYVPLPEQFQGQSIWKGQSFV